MQEDLQGRRQQEWRESTDYMLCWSVMTLTRTPRQRYGGQYLS